VSRAVRELRLARRSPCRHCGRNTKTVEGVCADCWGSKTAGHEQFRKTRKSPSWFSLDDELWRIVIAVALGLGVLYAVGRSL
jgi:hypothetical protein